MKISYCLIECKGLGKFLLKLEIKRSHSSTKIRANNLNKGFGDRIFLSKFADTPCYETFKCHDRTKSEKARWLGNWMIGFRSVTSGTENKFMKHEFDGSIVYAGQLKGSLPVHPDGGQLFRTALKINGLLKSRKQCLFINILNDFKHCDKAI
ncbi:MAG: hypothetical protein H6605_06055 [Flavobacteriales bacterium]|nr:hypothetical protein [Flavobacteriales bacterium]